MNHATWYNISPTYKGQAHMTKIYNRRTLTNDQAMTICIDSRTQDDIAKDYGISRAQVSRIQNGHRYANVTEHIRNRQAFSVKLSDLRWQHISLLQQAERVAEQINELEALERCTPEDETISALTEAKRKSEELDNKYRELLGRV